MEITVGFEQIWGDIPIRDVLFDQDVITVLDEEREHMDGEEQKGTRAEGEGNWRHRSIWDLD